MLFHKTFDTLSHIVGDLAGGGSMAVARYITLDQKSPKRTKKVIKTGKMLKKGCKKG